MCWFEIRKRARFLPRAWFSRMTKYEHEGSHWGWKRSLSPFGWRKTQVAWLWTDIQLWKACGPEPWQNKAGIKHVSLHISLVVFSSLFSLLALGLPGSSWGICDIGRKRRETMNRQCSTTSLDGWGRGESWVGRRSRGVLSREGRRSVPTLLSLAPGLWHPGCFWSAFVFHISLSLKRPPF